MGSEVPGRRNVMAQALGECSALGRGDPMLLRGRSEWEEGRVEKKDLTVLSPWPFKDPPGFSKLRLHLPFRNYPGSMEDRLGPTGGGV